MRKFYWTLAAAALVWPGLAAATQEEGEGAAPAAEEESSDVISIYGDGRIDKGMAAFRAGDYEQAEIEFELNLKCAERLRMLEEMAIEQSVSDAIGVEGGAPSRTGGWMDDGGIRVFDIPTNVYRGPVDPEDIPDRTCENSPWQLYMIGMSQIQLGKYAEAKRNFYRVIHTSRNPLLFDAHYRIALLEILDGNLDKAQKRLDTLIVLQSRCHRQDERCEYRAEIDGIIAYLEPALAKARSEAAAE